MLDKFLYLSIEKYKASYSQSKTTGQLFFEVHVGASNDKELDKNSEYAIKICTQKCNDFNKNLLKENDKEIKK